MLPQKFVKMRRYLFLSIRSVYALGFLDFVNDRLLDKSTLTLFLLLAQIRTFGKNLLPFHLPLRFVDGNYRITLGICLESVFRFLFHDNPDE